MNKTFSQTIYDHTPHQIPYGTYRIPAGTKVVPFQFEWGTRSSDGIEWRIVRGKEYMMTKTKIEWTFTHKDSLPFLYGIINNYYYIRLRKTTSDGINAFAVHMKNVQLIGT